MRKPKETLARGTKTGGCRTGCIDDDRPKRCEELTAHVTREGEGSSKALCIDGGLVLVITALASCPAASLTLATPSTHLRS
jgi:hypothetical protein